VLCDRDYTPKSNLKDRRSVVVVVIRAYLEEIRDSSLPASIVVANHAFGALVIVVRSLPNVRSISIALL